MNLPNFFVWKLFLWSSLRKSYSICRENSEMAKIWPFFGKNLANFWPKFTVLRVFWSLGISGRTYGFALVRPCVRSCVRDAISGDPHIWFFWNLAQSCILARLKKCSKWIFEKNSRFSRFWPKTANFCHIWPFLAQKSGFWTFSSNLHIRFV